VHVVFNSYPIPNKYAALDSHIIPDPHIIFDKAMRIDIAVLTDSKNTISQIIPKGNLAGKQGVTCERPEEDKIIIDTIRRFKGLESPVVILVVTPEVALNEELLYVAISRARTHLFIIGEKLIIDRIKNADVQKV